MARVLRRCLRPGVSPVFIPAGQPPCHGSAEHGHGWLQEPLLPRHGQRPGDLRRALAWRQEAVTTQHVHARLGGKTPAQHRRGPRRQKLPTGCVVPRARLPLAAGRVLFLRRVSWAGTVTLLRPSLRVGQQHSA